MTVAILDPSAEDRSRIREVLAGVVDEPLLDLDPIDIDRLEETLSGVRLVLLETDLPGDGGFDLLARLRLLRPDLPIVVVTRRVEEDRIVAAMKAGASDLVGKARLDRLPSIVREALTGHLTRRDIEQTRQSHERLRVALASAGRIAHDLGNAFQSIRLAVDLLRRIQDEPRRGALLDTVVSGIDRGRDLLGRLMLDVAHGEGAAPKVPDEPVLRAGRRQVILIVDDEPDVRDLVRLAIEGHGYRTLTAANGAEALVVFEQHRQEIAAVVVDLLMPVLDGPSLIRSLRQTAPTIPILPASGLPADPAMLAELSLRYFLPKPFTASQLLDTLERLLADEGRP